MVSQTELHNPFQGAHYPQPQMRQHAVMQSSQQMPQIQNVINTVEERGNFANTNGITAY